MNVILTNENKEFNFLYKELDDLYHEAALAAGISDSAFTIFYAIAALGDGCLQKDIADKFCISRQTINSSVKKLERENYLVLKHGKKRDMHLFLTPKGQQFTEQRIAPIIEAENTAFCAMTPEDTREFLRLSRKYITLFREEVRKYLPPSGTADTSQ